jgi:hypothetical protein
MKVDEAVRRYYDAWQNKDTGVFAHFGLPRTLRE